MLIEKKFMPLFIDDKRIMNKLLVNPILVDKALELIAHDEKFKEEYCNNETFELVVDHLVEKYGLNKNHLERLEKLFGDEVILYVENDALISLLLKEKEESITASDIKKERLKAAKRLLPRQLIFIAAGLLVGISLNFS